MRNALLAAVVIATLGLGLVVAALANDNYALAERVLRLERGNQDLVVAIEELDVEVWERSLELDAEALATKVAPADARVVEVVQ